MKNAGLSIHCHHSILIEYCYSYKERVDYIKKNKPKHERKPRLRLFKLLPKEAIDELPEYLIKADAEWDKAVIKMDKAYTEFSLGRDRIQAFNECWEATAELDKATTERNKAYIERDKACVRWWKADGEAWHAKWCGCKEWNGKEIVFKKEIKG